MTKRTKKAQPVARVKREYVVTFRLLVEQDETGNDKPFELENSIRVDLECLINNQGSLDGHVVYLEVEDVGAEEASVDAP